MSLKEQSVSDRAAKHDGGFWMLLKVIELRLRFIVLMAVTAAVFVYWDELANRYDKWMRPAGASRVAVSGLEYYCPMHPQVVQDEPGRCPLCGMPLARRKRGAKTPLAEGVTARVELSAMRAAQAGIKTVDVDYAPLERTLATVGYVGYDERLLANIVSKVPGMSRVEKLYVNFTGQSVEVGEKLAEMYSPELSQAIEELLSASTRASTTLTAGSEASRLIEEDRRAILRASREKLRRWGITSAQVDDILKRGDATFTIPILSTINGHVVKKNVVEGQEVQAGQTLFEVADLHTVWVQAQVYEGQLGLIKEGQAVEATVEAYPGEVFAGRLEFVQPHLDPATRTVEVRYALENPGHRLRPGMFATVSLKTSIADLPAFRKRLAVDRPAHPSLLKASLTQAEQKTCLVTGLKLGAMGEPVQVEVQGRRIWTCCAACPPKLKARPARYLSRLAPPPKHEVLSVPESAVIDAGRRKVVYVETDPGVFEGREVVLGPRVGDRFPVLSGVEAGERVAAAGAFLIDAETRINPALAGTPPAHEHASSTATATEARP